VPASNDKMLACYWLPYGKIPLNALHTMAAEQQTGNQQSDKSSGAVYVFLFHDI
jgi:hypothetical protein